VELLVTVDLGIGIDVAFLRQMKESDFILCWCDGRKNKCKKLVKKKPVAYPRERTIPTK
jgi:hypothetical protein